MAGDHRNLTVGVKREKRRREFSIPWRRLVFGAEGLGSPGILFVKSPWQVLEIGIESYETTASLEEGPATRFIS